MHFHDFELLGLVACIILLFNGTRMEFEKPYASHESGCSLEICQWCGEPCFAGAAISIDVYQPQFPGGTSISHYRSNQGFVEGQFNVST
jgi:hypothetical protein